MKIQQRRLFFQAAKSEAETHFLPRNNRRRYLCGWLAVTLAALLSFGCSTLTPDRVNVLAQIAGQAAALGSSEWLAKHPEQRASFQAVINALNALLKAGNFNEDAWTQLLSSLPVNALEGPNGALYVSEGLVVWDQGLKKPVAVRGEATTPVLKSALSGLKRAMVPAPPMPSRANAATGFLPEAPVPTPDTILDDQFRRLEFRNLPVTTTNLAK